MPYNDMDVRCNLNNRKKQRNKKNSFNYNGSNCCFFYYIIGIFKNQGGLERMVSDSIAAIDINVVKKPVEFVSNLFSEYNELKDVYKENKNFKSKIIILCQCRS